MIDIQNIDDNECFKWSIARYLNPANHHPARITKNDEDFGKKPNFKNIKLPVKIRSINKIEKQKNPLASVLLVKKIKKTIQPLNQKKII